MNGAQSTGVITRRQAKQFCCGDCKNTEKSAIKWTEYEGESVHEMTDALRKLERLFLRQNEYFDENHTGMHAAIDRASAPDLISSFQYCGSLLFPFNSHIIHRIVPLTLSVFLGEILLNNLCNKTFIYHYNIKCDEYSTIFKYLYHDQYATH